jgi:hypothetical protein
MVRYYSDDLPESSLVSAWEADGVTPAKYRTDYLITLPVPTPTGEDLEKIILLNCPVWWFEIKKSVLDETKDTSLNNIPLDFVSTLSKDSPLVATQIIVTPIQFRRALRKAGLLTTVNTFIASQSDEIQESWEYCVSIRRTDLLITILQSELNLTVEQMDDLFRSAAAEKV